MIPPLILGNPILMKHAPSTPLSAEAIETLFIDSGFDEGEYQNLYITNE
jgi:succinate-semialdehyde dehydrogenase/glutarate-semialdehyde dehydrogenase